MAIPLLLNTRTVFGGGPGLTREERSVNSIALVSTSAGNVTFAFIKPVPSVPLRNVYVVLYNSQNGMCIGKDKADICNIYYVVLSTSSKRFRRKLQRKVGTRLYIFLPPCFSIASESPSVVVIRKTYLYSMYILPFPFHLSFYFSSPSSTLSPSLLNYHSLSPFFSLSPLNFTFSSTLSILSLTLFLSFFLVISLSALLFYFFPLSSILSSLPLLISSFPYLFSLHTFHFYLTKCVASGGIV